MDLLQTISEQLNVFTQEERIMAGAMIAVFFLVLILRIALRSGYAAASALTAHHSKGLKHRDDIKRLPASAFARAAADYAEMLEKGARDIDPHDVARHAALSNRLLFFNFNSLGAFVASLELAFPLFSALFVIVAQSRTAIALLAAAIFLLMRIFAAIFDIKSARLRYISTLARALNRHIGRFYPAEASAAIYTFGSDLKDYLSRQSTLFNDAMAKISADFTGAVKTSVSAMTTSVEATMAAVLKSHAENLDSAEKMNQSAAAFSAALDKAVAATPAIIKLGAVAENVQAQTAALQSLLRHVDTNQQALDAAVSQYETVLKNFTAQIGDALGKIIAYHMHNATGAAAAHMADNLQKAQMVSHEQIRHVTGLFDQLQEQVRFQNQLLLNQLEVRE